MLGFCQNSFKKGMFVVFCPEKVAILMISGIITTNLGKTATLTRIAGRKKTDTSLQNMPFSQIGEGHFFCLLFFFNKQIIFNKYSHMRFLSAI
jgi:hypothetical protein